MPVAIRQAAKRAKAHDWRPHESELVLPGPVLRSGIQRERAASESEQASGVRGCQVLETSRRLGTRLV